MTGFLVLLSKLSSWGKIVLSLFSSSLYSISSGSCWIILAVFASSSTYSSLFLGLYEAVLSVSVSINSDVSCSNCVNGLFSSWIADNWYLLLQ